MPAPSPSTIPGTREAVTFSGSVTSLDDSSILGLEKGARHGRSQKSIPLCERSAPRPPLRVSIPHLLPQNNRLLCKTTKSFILCSPLCRAFAKSSGIRQQSEMDPSAVHGGVRSNPP
ncbi:uncharacterized protein STEHIDRAFT_117936 [Stereum hirsutum FP-91666 SS1]|uniref:uncharacterized protein n=1 Tax=Stereum hirsutum (strain FP-91666) TaxID=721885 RepID=UPI000440EEE6|nr:uncharacterized protein STEHIDRAFT_117936 [Stereum hirsutum FP-91666 SS1]EIM90621.1 hypothetical protein STEHIDRAFT_117936 [Stereum hirsutum FP-91666 SS1]